MGTSNIKSSVVGVGSNSFKGFGTVAASIVTGTKCRGFVTMSASTIRTPIAKSNAVTATGLTVNTAATGVTYMKLGGIYLFSGAKNTEATIVANATKITATPKGSIYISSGGGSVWVFRSDTAASVIPMV